jgi:hypothetical protein
MIVIVILLFTLALWWDFVVNTGPVRYRSMIKIKEDE